jgi:hypothetical protein
MATYDQKINSSRNDGYGLATWWGDYNDVTVGANVAGFFRFESLPMAQGAVINSAYIEIYTAEYGATNAVTLTIRAIDEDNTALFPSSSGSTSDPWARARTTAGVGFNIAATRNVLVTSGDIKTVIQEIVDRGGWTGGNALAIVLENNGSAYQNDLFGYNSSTTKCMRLVIDYTSTSTYSKSIEASASIIKENTDYGLKITKPTYEVDTDTNPSHFIFDSSLGTLKYFTTGSVDLELVDVEYQGSDSIAINHNLGYIPYVEVYVQNYLDEWEPCPSVGSGASVFWQLTYAITTTQIIFYASVYGDFTETFSFTFKYFIFRNEITF